MAADVLTYNALAEINQELRAENVGLGSAIIEAGGSLGGGGGGGGAASEVNQDNIDIVKWAGSPNFGLSCLIPKVPASGASWTSGFKVCDTTSYFRCGNSCNWTVPSGVTCARFQIWGAGGGSATGCCCGGSPNGGSGAYASVIIPVSPGDTYTLCAGCAYCCYNERAQMTADGNASYVQGNNLNNFCAEGGESSIWCEVKTRQQIAAQAGSYCMYAGSCICNSGSDYCSNSTETGGLGRCNDCRNHYQSTASCKTFYGTSTGGSGVYGLPGQFSYFRYQHGAYNPTFRHPGVYGFPTTSCCCQQNMSNENAGCCYQACSCAIMRVPGAGAWGYTTCGGDTNGCADVGRMGMVCVSYC